MSQTTKLKQILNLLQSKQVRDKDRITRIMNQLHLLKDWTEINAHYNKENWESLTNQIKSIKTRGHYDLATRIERAVEEQQKTIVKYEELIRENREIVMDIINDDRQDETYVNEKIEEWTKNKRPK